MVSIATGLVKRSQPRLNQGGEFLHTRKVVVNIYEFQTETPPEFALIPTVAGPYGRLFLVCTLSEVLW